jgi:hypothetical protein
MKIRVLLFLLNLLFFSILCFPHGHDICCTLRATDKGRYDPPWRGPVLNSIPYEGGPLPKIQHVDHTFDW